MKSIASSSLFLLTLMAGFSPIANAWSFSKVSATSPQQSIPTTTRKTFLDQAAVLLGTCVVAPMSAHADVTNKLSSSSALRTLKSSIKKLNGMEESVISASEYDEMRQALRAPPVSDVRKACFTIIRGEEDGPDAEALAVKYRTFITNLESMDTTAAQAMRGRKLGEDEFREIYSTTVQTLQDFVTLAEETVVVPVPLASEV